MPNTDVLIFVEDPGAANYVAPLPIALAERGWRTRLLADGCAKDSLLERGVCPEVVQHAAVASQILLSSEPRLLMIGTSENPDTLGLALVAEARSVGIESIGVVDAQANASYRFRGGSHAALTYAPDWLLVPDEWTKKAYVALCYPAEQVIVCGHPHYDHVREGAARLAKKGRNALRRSLLPRAPDDRPIGVFVAEISTGLNPQQYQRSSEYTLHGKGASTGRTEIVLEEFLDAVQLVKPRPYLVLRLHPKNTLGEFAPFLDEFDHVSKSEPPLDLIYIADFVIGMTSMLLLEAALIGRRTLSIIPRSIEMEWLPSVRLGITPYVTTRDQLKSALSNLLQDSPQILQSHDDAIVFGSLQRIVNFTESLLNSQRDGRHRKISNTWLTHL